MAWDRDQMAVAGGRPAFKKVAAIKPQTLSNVRSK
jgi:hypothetical protein